MPTRWFIFSTVMTLGFCYYGDPFSQDLGDVPDNRRTDWSSQLTSQPKATSEAFFPRYESSQGPNYLNRPPAAYTSPKSIRVASLPKDIHNQIPGYLSRTPLSPTKPKIVGVTSLPKDLHNQLPNYLSRIPLSPTKPKIVGVTSLPKDVHNQLPNYLSRIPLSPTKPKSVGVTSLPKDVHNQPSAYLSRIPLSPTKPKSVRVTSLPKEEPRPIKSSKLVEGTPKNFKDIVVGRCWEYQTRIGIKESDQIDCWSVWNYFKQAFAFKGPCEVTTNDYRSFLEKIEEEIPKDKALLWTGCRELAHKLSDFKYSRRFTTLEDTLAGYMFTGLSWCGSKQPPGIDFKSCPYECSIQAPFWAMANYKFALKVKGVVHVLMNGTRKHINDGNVYPSYMKDRYYFGPYVIPNLDRRKITEVRIMVAHTLQVNPLERCGEATIEDLQNHLIKSGFKVKCYDDPDIVKHILCVDHPMLAGCTTLAGSSY